VNETGLEASDLLFCLVVKFNRREAIETSERTELSVTLIVGEKSFSNNCIFKDD
jgi:hypothetical protein